MISFVTFLAKEEKDSLSNTICGGFINKYPLFAARAGELILIFNISHKKYMDNHKHGYIIIVDINQSPTHYSYLQLGIKITHFSLQVEAILSWVSARDVISFGATCSAFHLLSLNSILWKMLFQRHPTGGLPVNDTFNVAPINWKRMTVFKCKKEAYHPQVMLVLPLPSTSVTVTYPHQQTTPITLHNLIFWLVYFAHYQNSNI